MLKGAIILNGCIVGMNSLVNKQEQNEKVILAGNPARGMKENIAWYRGSHEK